jgi:thiol reductant ABC exporter CydD subunit
MFYDKRLLRFLLQAGNYIRPVFLMTVLFSLLGAVMIILQAKLISNAISRVFLTGQILEDIKPVLGNLLLVLVIRAVTVMGSEVSANVVAARIKSNLRLLLFQGLIASGSEQIIKNQKPDINSQKSKKAGTAFETHKISQSQVEENSAETGELVSIILQGVDALDAYYSQYIPQLLLAALIPILILGFIFPLEWLSGLIMLITLPLIPFFMVLIGKSAEKLTRKQWKTLNRMSAYFLDSLQGLATLKMLNQNTARSDRIARVSDQYRQVTMKVLRITFLSAFVLELVGTISTALVAVQIGLRLLYGQVDFEPALFILVLAPEFYLPLRMLGQRFHASMSGVSAAVRIFEVLEVLDTQTNTVRFADAPPNQDKKTEADNQPPVLQSMTAKSDLNLGQPFAIYFNHVSYQYPGRQQEALRDVTFTIPSGMKTVLVGLSGSGKSTVIKLLLRMIEPSQGQITFTAGSLLSDNSRSSSIMPGISLQAMPNLAVWRSQIAWVPQNPYLFNASIADNIRLGRPDASMEEVETAARQAHLHDFIASLPETYGTLIGEMGARLSGGQAQRLALARAFILNAPLLLFDEPTTSLDLETETLLVESISSSGVMSQTGSVRTAVVVAHRLQTIVDAHQIIVFHKGSIVEAGTHAELIHQGGTYERLVKAVGWDMTTGLSEPIGVIQ